MKKEYDFSKAKVHRGPIIKDKKLQKTIRLDPDVFAWLLEQSESRGVPYQTLLNSLLKQQMKKEKSLIDRIERIEAKLGIKKSG